MPINFPTEKQICSELINENRLFTILTDKLKYNEIFNQKLYNNLIKYIDKYIAYHSLSESEVATYYLNYIRQYNKDVRNFDKTRKYPLQISDSVKIPTRIPYNIILLLSTILTVHRFKIMQLIQGQTIFSEKSLFIGIGPGLELHLLRNKLQNIVAYDLTLDPFLQEYHREVIFRNEYFNGNGEEQFDSIFLIELLEHLQDPFELLTNCEKVLRPNGRIYLTTATNIPQFDHLYNFEPDHLIFEERVKKIGLTISFVEDIPHAFITAGIDSKNRYYILKK